MKVILMDEVYDITIHGGRVIDPETGFDAVADLAISGDRIAAIAPDLPPGRRSYDATGRIVAPGFIDIHAHGQSIAADRMQAFDGVTTALELEIGALPVGAWYDHQATQRRVLNYGTAAAWIFARKTVISGTNLEPVPSLEMMGRSATDSRWSDDVGSADEIERIMAMVREGIREGGLGIGIPNAYAPGAGVKEMTALCQLAAEQEVPTFTHVAYSAIIDPKSAIEAYVRLIGYAGATGAHMHICHLNSTSSTDIGPSVAILRKAQAQGLPVTVEAYPYGVGSTVISAVFLCDPQYPERSGRGYDAIQRVSDGHRFGSRAELLARRDEDPGQLILTHFLDVESDPEHSDMLDQSVLYPGGAIASDAMPWTTPEGRIYLGDAWPVPEEMTAHPRSSGTFTRFLRIWAREREAIGWADAIAKCTLIPAQILEKATPEALRKGRLQQGMDADVVVFDPLTVTDNATFEHMNRASSGMELVIVNGTPVIADGVLDTSAAPGRPVRHVAA